MALGKVECKYGFGGGVVWYDGHWCGWLSLSLIFVPESTGEREDDSQMESCDRLRAHDTAISQSLTWRLRQFRSGVSVPAGLLSPSAEGTKADSKRAHCTMHCRLGRYGCAGCRVLGLLKNFTLGHCGIRQAKTITIPAMPRHTESVGSGDGAVPAVCVDRCGGKMISLGESPALELNTEGTRRMNIINHASAVMDVPVLGTCGEF